MVPSSFDLLERLARLTSCPFLSDLRYLNPSDPLLREALLATPAGDYSARCWQDAFSYLTNRQEPPPTDAETCRQRLLALCGAVQIQEKAARALDTSGCW